MSPSIDYQDPPPPSPGRSAGTWLILMAVYLVGTILCIAQFAILGWLILSIL